MAEESEWGLDKGILLDLIDLGSKQFNAVEANHDGFDTTKMTTKELVALSAVAGMNIASPYFNPFLTDEERKQWKKRWQAILIELAKRVE